MSSAAPEPRRIETVEVARGVFAPSAALDAIETSCGRFVANATTNARPETLNTKINTCMTEVEARVAERARRSGSELIVLDGPLRESTRELRDAVGVVKSHDVKYLPTALDRVVADLAAGERTPVFALDARFRKFSWYLRLPGPKGGPWAGIVRCEASAALRAGDVIALADRVAATLPRFASAPHKDARAPQNLYPIGGLERDLRHRLGDAAMIYRSLRRASVVPGVRPVDRRSALSRGGYCPPGTDLSTIPFATTIPSTIPSTGADPRVVS